MIAKAVPQEIQELKKSPLHAAHEKLGARFTSFAAWEMPVFYSAIMQEHLAVRKSAGVFDISHMGQFFLSGAGAGDWLNEMLTNDTRKLSIGKGQYTLMLNPEGGVIDDLIIYRTREEQWLLVVNAAKVDEDFAWLKKHLSPHLTLKNQSKEYAGFAVQGPDSSTLYAKVIPQHPLPPRNGISGFNTEGEDLWVCRTGYTGEDGFELFCSISKVADYFQLFIEAGATPCGLGARDTLRLEMGYPLNSSDLDPSHTPLEAGLGAFVKMEKEKFIGQEGLLKQKHEGLKIKLFALEVLGKSPPPRPGYSVLCEGTEIAKLTSGALSPSLSKGIAMAYLPVEYEKENKSLSLSIRNRNYPLAITKKPFA